MKPFFKRFALSIIILISLFGAAGARAAEKSVFFILDTSASMDEYRRGVESAFLAALDAASPDVEVSLRIFNQKDFRTKESCEETELLLPPGSYSAKEAARELKNVIYGGQTPLALALEETQYAIERDKKPKEIVIITDGRDTCNGEPCRVAEYLHKNLRVRVHVIAFGPDDEYSRLQLQCIADSGYGSFREMGGPTNGLSEILSGFLSVSAFPLIVVLVDENGQRIAGRITITNEETGETAAATESPLHQFSPTLPSGDYTVTAEVDGSERTVEHVKLDAKNEAFVRITFGSDE